MIEGTNNTTSVLCCDFNNQRINRRESATRQSCAFYKLWHVFSLSVFPRITNMRFINWYYWFALCWCVRHHHRQHQHQQLQRHIRYVYRVWDTSVPYAYCVLCLCVPFVSTLFLARTHWTRCICKHDCAVLIPSEEVEFVAFRHSDILSYTKHGISSAVLFCWRRRHHRHHIVPPWASNTFEIDLCFMCVDFGSQGTTYLVVQHTHTHTNTKRTTSWSEQVSHIRYDNCWMMMMMMVTRWWRSRWFLPICSRSEWACIEG